MSGTSLVAKLGGLKAPVSRRTYLLSGLVLAVIKLALDNAVVYGTTHQLWSPLRFYAPTALLSRQAESTPAWSQALLVLQAVPFIWIGTSMSVRRAADAGASAWCGFLFLVPGVNLVVIAVLSCLPTAPVPTWSPAAFDGPYRAAPDAAPVSTRSPIQQRHSAQFLAVAVAMGIGLAMTGLTVYALDSYGLALFFLTPVVMGAASSSVYNRTEVRSAASTIGIAFLGALFTGTAILLFGLDGVLCLPMAFPIAASGAMAGALIARAIIVSTRRTQALPLMALAPVLPLLAVMEARTAVPTPREVTTTVEVDAPPEAVWENVVHFSELPPPAEWVFRAGIAYPIRAVIGPRADGTLGVGSVRRCEFSTGPFVEPITVWDEPHRLAFDVTSQPPSLTELSPYKNVHALHVEGYMASQGGEFRLTALPGGRTRLEGTTHYTLAIFPELYWTPWAELLLHDIHQRVLEHVKALSEASRAGGRMALPSPP